MHQVQSQFQIAPSYARRRHPHLEHTQPTPRTRLFPPVMPVLTKHPAPATVNEEEAATYGAGEQVEKDSATLQIMAPSCSYIYPKYPSNHPAATMGPPSNPSPVHRPNTAPRTPCHPTAQRYTRHSSTHPPRRPPPPSLQPPTAVPSGTSGAVLESGSVPSVAWFKISKTSAFLSQDVRALSTISRTVSGSAGSAGSKGHAHSWSAIPGPRQASLPKLVLRV